MSNRHERRADIACFRRDASRRDLLTFLVEIDDARLSRAPLLQHTADNWINLLSTRCRHCIICSCWVASKQEVGALLLATPATVRPTSASACAVCKACWDADLGREALERAATAALQEALPGGRFEPQEGDLA